MGTFKIEGGIRLKGDVTPQGAKNEAFKNNYETEVAGSKGKSYTVKCESNVWSCTCPAYGWSGNAHTCKHITQVKTENKWN